MAEEAQRFIPLPLEAFRKDLLLCYFDPNTRAFIIVDGHKTGLGAILAQGPSLEKAKSLALASRTTNVSKRYSPHLDLEAALTLDSEDSTNMLYANLL